MKNIQEYTGRLIIIERMNNSVNGNPRFKLYLEGTGVSFQTKADCSYCYDIKNMEYQLVKLMVGIHYGKLTLNTIKRVLI